MYELVFLISLKIILVCNRIYSKFLKNKDSYSSFIRTTSWIVLEVEDFVWIFLFGRISITAARISVGKKMSRVKRKNYKDLVENMKRKYEFEE